MKTEFIKENNKLTVLIEGSLNTNHAPEFESALQANWEGVTELIIDFSAIDFISSSGLRVMLLSQKHMATCGSMVLKNVNPDIREIFEMTGFDELLAFE